MQFSQHLKYSPISRILGSKRRDKRRKIGLLSMFGSHMPKFDVGIVNGLMD